MKNRREYKVAITVNNRRVTSVVIDPHYELKHSSSINDKVILEIVELINGGSFPIAAIDEAFEYFVVDMLYLKGRYYKLIWLLENDKFYIGIINAYRRKK